MSLVYVVRKDIAAARAAIEETKAHGTQAVAAADADCVMEDSR